MQKSKLQWVQKLSDHANKESWEEHIWIVIPHALIWFFAGLAMLITLKLDQGWNIMKGLWYVLWNIREILAKRKKIQEVRKIDESTLWKFIHRTTPRGYYKQRFIRYITLGLHG